MIDPSLRIWGFARVGVVCADTAAFLDACTRDGIVLHDAVVPENLTCQFTVSRPDLPKVRTLAERMGCRFQILSRRGLPEAVRRIRRHRARAMALVISALALAVSSLFVWDVQVTKNDSGVPDAKILRVLSAQGVVPGSFWPAFRSERIRTRALLELPELSFLAVNVRGGRAEAEVRSAVPVPEIFDPALPGDVCAGRPGIVESVAVLAGEPKVSRGQAVSEGQILIAADPASPRALGEIRAYTYYELTACAQLLKRTAEPAGPEHSRFALVFGGKRINFYFGSGILPPDCVKITQQHILRSENAFSLPVCLVRETWRENVCREEEADISVLRAQLEGQLADRLAHLLGERGEILENRFTAAVSGGRLLVTMRSKCLERIDRDTPRSLK